MLINSAVEAVKNAYAPYSKFHVGSSVLLKSGKIITGSNQENAAFPSGLCAERVALFHASHQYPNDPIQAIAIATHSEKDNKSTPIFPCGSCRQVILEYENKYKTDIRTFVINSNGNIYAIDKAKDLLPMAFVGDFLKKLEN